ncbi:hypothetical protein QN394_28545, partial [Pseudomonas sp. 5S2]
MRSGQVHQNDFDVLNRRYPQYMFILNRHTISRLCLHAIDVNHARGGHQLRPAATAQPIPDSNTHLRAHETS